MVVLAWALGRAELPPYDEPCVPYRIGPYVGFLAEYGETVLVDAGLRPHAEIEHWADTYWALHWRLRQYGLDRSTIDFARAAAAAWFGPVETSDLKTIDGDLAIAGERIDRVSDLQYHEAVSIAQERHQAFNWLLGFEPVYSQVTTDT